MRKFFKFFFLPRGRKKIIGQAFVLVLIIRIGLWLFPFKRLSGYLAQFKSFDASVCDVDWTAVEVIVSAVRECSRFVPFATCLTQALAAQTLLWSSGQDSQLKFGVDKDKGDRFIAHAWIEIDGKIIIGKYPHHRRYIVLGSPGSVVI